MDLKAGKELIRFAAIGIGSAVRRAINAEDAERFLSQSLGALPGAPAKIAQLMGMRSFAEIPSPAAMQIEDVKSIILKECPELFEQLDSISDWAKTASIGQTHRGQLKSGEMVAVKVQYPNVGSAIASQIDAVFGVAGFSPARNFDFDARSTREFLRQKLIEETDYRLELKNQILFHRRYDGSNVVVPRVFESFSTPRILTQTWEDSESLADFSGLTDVDQKNTASALFTSWLFDSMFGLGLMHSDLNPSNYGFRKDHGALKLVVYDFGAVMSLVCQNSAQMFHWLEATRNADGTRIRAALEGLGFSSERLKPIERKLIPLSRALLKPLLYQGQWKADDWQLQDSLDQILGQDKWWFRTAGPPWFMYLMRSIQGWHHCLLAVGGSVDVGKIFQPWLDQLRVLAKVYSLKDSPSKGSDPIHDHFLLRTQSAKSLMVRVKDGAETIIELTLPAGAVSELEGLLPDHVAQHCRNDGIRLDLIRQKALESSLIPQELFSACLGTRTYKVWLE